ncbi:DUF1330 domain-containing protein [Frigidibacter sp. ROC022]|uniref:DUF1330 domain-containing protein n=1 Tax=Frigidibacter sp. ROC022 TaxID=2971796 RepID=UPI00215A8032|nr:DUF1330 domain-containing protein [Frigidibacter sp. ROC022]MCR8723849.1 DUF1330 domain-containing protein [Frigidibacter sp. ROC022]
MRYLHPTDATARALIARRIDGPILMLNLLRFRAEADYAATPQLAPEAPVSGAEAYGRYSREITPLLEATGGAVIFEAEGGGWFIGPEAEHWDRVLIVRQASLQSFFAFAGDPAAQTALAHRTAALADSRLLPMAAGLPFTASAP